VKSFLYAVVLLTGSLPAFGQQPMRFYELPKSNLEAQLDHSGHSCATAEFMASKQGRAALMRFHEARKNGTLPVAGKTLETYEIGQSAAFRIPKNDSTWISAEFELRSAGERWRAWIRSDVPDQDVITDARLEVMKAAIDEATLEESIDPNKGIFENNTDIFGETPVFPAGSEGIVDLLIFEKPFSPTVLGAFWPPDLDPSAPDSISNHSEVLYLAIRNFFVEGNESMEATVAHELQHLIMANFDPLETTFVNEGQSEYAQEMNGYGVVPPFYLYGPAPLHNEGFFDWEGLYSGDYQRASLWTGYVAERVGPEAVGMITQNGLVGLNGYQDALEKAGSALTFQELLADFHTANLVNDRALDARFGYTNKQRSGELGKIQVTRFEGSQGNGLVTDSLIVRAGGAEYFTVENVKDITMSVDVFAPPSQLENRRSQMLVRAIATDLDGNMSMAEFNPSDEIHELTGSFSTVRFVFAHLRPESTQHRTSFDINWTVDPDRAVDLVTYAIDRPLVRNGLGPLGLDSQGRDAQATMFTPPSGSVLDRVTLATYYFSQFSNGGFPANAPRDFTLKVWESNGFGFPGEVIHSQEVVDPVPWFPAVQLYSWLDVEIDPALGQDGAALPDTIFVGIENAGSDGNYLVVWPSAVNQSPAPETGFLRLPIDGDLAWIRLWDLVLSSDPDTRVYNRTALPIQARFVVDDRAVAIEESTEIPEAVSLEQNYPNPFNPSTQIRFALPESDNVTLEVFDVTGRQIATLLDGRQAAGSYTVTVDASSWTSGMYFYRLTTGSDYIVKRMVVLK
jgi:hypothetical protein